ncbi:hypothetical protein B0H13DRAFT_2391894 [Mycena leptocephala]|nr:hypothetical protein B0H13DRAFT_2391894 [Mycena leptocephala]
MVVAEEEWRQNRSNQRPAIQIPPAALTIRPGGRRSPVSDLMIRHFHFSVPHAVLSHVDPESRLRFAEALVTAAHRCLATSGWALTPQYVALEISPQSHSSSPGPCPQSGHRLAVALALSPTTPFTSDPSLRLGSPIPPTSSLSLPYRLHLREPSPHMVPGPAFDRGKYTQHTSSYPSDHPSCPAPRALHDPGLRKLSVQLDLVLHPLNGSHKERSIVFIRPVDLDSSYCTKRLIFTQYTNFAAAFPRGPHTFASFPPALKDPSHGM